MDCVYPTLASMEEVHLLVAQAAVLGGLGNEVHEHTSFISI